MGEVIRLRVASSEEAITLQSASGSLAVEAVSPRVAFEKVDSGTRLDITDIDGTKSAILPDGATGQTGPAGETGPQGERGETGPAGPKGEPGNDGFSPTIEVSDITGGHILSITDKTGTTLVTVQDGAEGPQGPRGMDGLRGPQGETGPAGPQGDPGDDYVLTEADKSEIAGKIFVPQPLEVSVLSSGYFIVHGSGNASQNATYSASTYVDVTEWMKIRYKRTKTNSSSSYAGMAFYDSEKEYISGVQTVLNQDGPGYYGLYDVDVPTGAAYARFTMLADTQTYGAFEVYGLRDVLAFDTVPTADSFNAVTSGGIYTAISAKADPVVVETVSGVNPVIAGADNHRYMCGTVDTLTLTVPVSGIVDVVFTSGTTPTVLSVPSGIKWPGWFNPSSLDASTTYEINIMDGIYGAVMAWT